MGELNLITQEIGSFRKPDYLSKNFHKLGESSEFFERASRATLETLKIFENSGLENVGVAGEMFRWEMYEHFATRVQNLEFYGMVRSFDNRYYKKGSVTGPIGRRESLHGNELEFLLKNTKEKLKIPITGPYTMMDWSFNEYYASRYDLAISFGEIINEEINELRSVWKKYRNEEKMEIQIDEPAATTHPSEMNIVLDSVNRAVEGIQGIETSIHVCYSKDYGDLFKIIPDLNIDGYNLEFANRDTLNLGVGLDKRPGYVDVKRFKEYCETGSNRKFLGLGVTDVHIDTVESVELISDRINTAREIMDDDRQLRINPDCGLRTRSIQIGYEKLHNMNLAVGQIKQQ
ncbi:methionine synthase [Cuniculiplasma sp. SKW4]|uniref:methionine synthase n=1 Tax=Cuniculiplasma sp. SKW4 TaxID=3400171 RepID=UPI003FD099EE